MTTAWRPSRRAGTVVLLLALLGGCTGGQTTPAPTPTPSSVQSGGGGISPPDLPTPPAIANAQGAVADVTFGACATTPGTQVVNGTVLNSTRAATDYLITINWTNDTYDVTGRGITVVRDLKPGARASWKLSGKVGSGASHCVPNVLRGTLAR